MTKSFDLNASGDIYIGPDGNLAVAQDLRAIEVACLNVCRARLGEMVLTIKNGLPYFETVFNDSPNLAIFQSYLLAAISSVDGVSSVTSITMSVANNTLTFIAKIATIFGPGTVTNG